MNCVIHKIELLTYVCLILSFKRISMESKQYQRYLWIKESLSIKNKELMIYNSGFIWFYTNYD